MKTINIAALTTLLATALILPSCTTPPWAFEAEKIAEVALPIVQGLTTIVGGSPAVTQAENDINLLITLFDKYQATPAAGTLQQILTALSTANTDITQIMPAAGIKNSGTQDKVAAVLQLITSEFGNIATLIPSQGTPTTSSSSLKKADSSGKEADSSQPTANSSVTTTTPVALSSKKFKAKYNEIVKGDPEFKKL
jgi:hypothetical protein